MRGLISPPGMEPASPALHSRLLTTGHQGSSLPWSLLKRLLIVYTSNHWIGSSRKVLICRRSSSVTGFRLTVPPLSDSMTSSLLVFHPSLAAMAMFPGLHPLLICLYLPWVSPLQFPLASLPSSWCAWLHPDLLFWATVVLLEPSHFPVVRAWGCKFLSSGKWKLCR